MRLVRGVLALVIAALALPFASVGASAGRLIIEERDKHRVIAVDRESRGILAENVNFTRPDCLARASDDELVVCDNTQFIRLGLDLQERKVTPTRFTRVESITVLTPDRWLVSDTDRHAVVTIDALGKELSTIPVHYPSNAARLADGSLIIADGTSTLTVRNADGSIARQVPLARWAASLDVSADGHILVGESLAYEQFDTDLRREWTRKSPSRVSCVQQLAHGEILLCEPDSHRVSIIDANGDVAWRLDGLQYAWRALYVP
jgi:hypothetical protein